MAGSPKILTLDIETSPNVAHVWGLFKQTISLNQLMESSAPIAFGAKWHDSQRCGFWSDFHDGHDAMVNKAHELMSTADIVVHYNGTGFDMPKLRGEIALRNDLTPTPQIQEVDLLRVVRKQFGFTSNKLDYIAQRFGVGAKANHEGHTLWVRCMAGDPAAWAIMRRYCMQDVRITERLYDRILPWIPGHPNMALFVDSDAPLCPTCGSDNITRQGVRRTAVSSYQRYQCSDCGAWSRSGKSLDRVDLRPAA